MTIDHLPQAMKSAVMFSSLGLLMSASVLQADDFTGFSMNFVDIGNTTNVDDDTGYGAVGYNYQMGVNEVSEGMISAYNTANPGVLITQDARGADKPATSVTWNEAARFVNWLNTSEGYQAAYNVSGTANTDITLWSSANAWQTGGENLFRHKDAHYFLPSEDEWYKAAYYDPDHGGVGVGGYYNYATGSDTAPGAVASGTDPNTAVYSLNLRNPLPGPADVDDAGGLSYYGTMAQNGNILEWGESAYDGGNDLNSEVRVQRGGSYQPQQRQAELDLLASDRNHSNLPYQGEGTYNVGFRVASISAVPEPSSVGLLVIGAMGLLMKRRRG